MFIAIFWDVAWFAMKRSEYTADQKSDGGLEKNIRSFALYMSYIAFFVRLFVALVYWKASLAFAKIIQKKQTRIVIEPYQKELSPRNGGD